MTTNTILKTAILSATAVIAGAATAFADPAIVGDVAVYGGTVSVFNDADGYDFSGKSVIGMNARLRHGMFQFDLNTESAHAGYGYDYATEAAALHVIRPMDFGTLGAMVSLGKDGLGEVTVGGAPYATYAIEGASAVGSSMIDAQVGYFAPQDDVYIDSGYYIHLGSVTPVTDSLDLKLDVSAVRMAEAGTSDYSYLEAVSYGAFVEYAASETFSVYGGVSGGHVEEASEGEKWSAATVLVGVRIPLGKAASNDLVFADHNPLTGVNHLRMNDWE